MEILYFIGIYLMGFFTTLTFLKFFGKRIGFDYDDARLWDDYQSNAEAYFVFSIFWFALIPITIIIGTFRLLEKASEWYLKL